MPITLQGELPGMPTPSDTLLTISGLGEMLYQARGLIQTLEVIGAAKDQERTINGKLIDLANPQFRKFSSKITCKDINSPPIDNLWPGMTVEIQCAATLSYFTGNPGSPSRPEVSGSSYVLGNYTFYRPVMTMLIGAVTLHDDEWKADVQWELDLEEV